MKLLAALTLLLPAVHVAALPGNFGLRIGPNTDDPVVVKSPKKPGYYVIDTSVTDGPAERFEWGDNEILIDQEEKSVFVDHYGDLRVGLDVRWATTGFYFDKEKKLANRNNDEKSWYLCPSGEAGIKTLQFTLSDVPDCKSIDLYEILRFERSHA